MARAITAEADEARRGSAAGVERDARIDFFRGLALLMIFVNHLPGNVFSIVTLANLGFSDAAEVFVFLAGVSAVLAYGKVTAREGVLAGVRAVFRRVRALYLYHLGLFAVVAGTALFAAWRFGDPMYLEQGLLEAVVSEPATALLRAATLTYLPAYLDILPLYMVLLALIPAILALFRLHPLAPLALSALVYGASRFVDLNLPNYPETQRWFFNPAAWQLLFVIGATVAHLAASGRWRLRSSSTLTIAAALYIAAAFVIAAPWADLPGLANAALVPATWLPLIDKTNLPLLRLVNVLAQAWLVAALMSRTSAVFDNAVGRSIVSAGRNSLEVFVLGVALSVMGSVLVKETAYALPVQIGVTLFGFAAMLMLGMALDRRRRAAKALGKAVSFPSMHADGVLATARPLTNGPQIAK